MTENTPEKSSAKTSRKISGLLIFGVLLLVMIFASYRNTISGIACSPEILDTNPDVIMLGTWWCTYCAEARRYFQKNNVHYCEYDIESSPEGEKLYQQANGGGIPILLIDDKKYVGFDAVAFEQLMQARQKS
ncbi:MAG: glutaredoxin domain-containing protein [Gammaproteobacteria bacterium]